MPDYRFYLIGSDGRISGPLCDHSAPHDEAAVRHAKRLLDSSDIEIWQETRLVAYLVRGMR